MNPYIYPGLRQSFKDLNKIKALPQRKELIEDVIIGVCKAFKISEQELFSRNRKQNYVNARFMAMVIYRYYMDMSLHEIGRQFQLDHSSVIHGLKKGGIYLECDFDYREKLSECIEFNFGWTLAAPKVITKAINWMNQTTKP